MLTKFAGLEINVRTGINHTWVCMECACVWVWYSLSVWATASRTPTNQERSHAHVREGIIDKCTATAEQVHIQ